MHGGPCDPPGVINRKEAIAWPPATLGSKAHCRITKTLFLCIDIENRPDLAGCSGFPRASTKLYKHGRRGQTLVSRTSQQLLAHPPHVTKDRPLGTVLSNIYIQSVKKTIESSERNYTLCQGRASYLSPPIASKFPQRDLHEPVCSLGRLITLNSKAPVPFEIIYKSNSIIPVPIIKLNKTSTTTTYDVRFCFTLTDDFKLQLNQNKRSHRRSRIGYSPRSQIG